MSDYEKLLEKCTRNVKTDDTSVTCSAGDVQQKCSDLQMNLYIILEWMSPKKVFLNNKKSNFMVIDHKSQLNNIQDIAYVEIWVLKLGYLNIYGYINIEIWVLKYITDDN